MTTTLPDEHMASPQAAPLRDRVATLAGRVRGRVVLQGLALALVIVAVVTTIIALVVGSTVSTGSISNNLPSFATSVGAFIGFLAAGMWVSNHVRHDRMLHAAALVGAGFVAALVISALDQALGAPIEQAMPGGNGVDGETVHLGFWLVNWVVLPSAALLGAAIVPRKGEGWGEYHSEPEDTEF